MGESRKPLDAVSNLYEPPIRGKTEVIIRETEVGRQEGRIVSIP
jgi:hypothetical protein